MECPITYELLAESGDNAPLMLSACGHTISAFAAAHLITTERTRVGNGPVAIRCPMCAQKQQVVYTVSDVPRNLALIKLLRAKSDGENLQRRRASGIAGVGPPADAEAGRTGSTRKKTPFTESGPHQPCVMPACGHTFKRIAVQNLLNRARRSQVQAQQQQADQIDERRKMSVCGIIGIENFDENAPIARDPVATYAIECPSCGTKQPEVKDASEFPPNWMLIEYLREEAAELQNSVPDDSSDSNESLQQKIEPEFKANNSTEGQRMHRADVEGGSARLRERERYSILQRDYSSGLSDSLRAANRQKLIKAVEVAIWKYTDEAKHVQAALAQVPDDRMAHVVFISYSPIWQQMQCVRKSEVCRALRCQVRDAGEQEDDDCSSIWQLGPPERPQSGLVYEHLEQAFYEALLQGNLSLDVLDALKQALNDTQFRRAANKIFSCLYSRCPSDDSMLALLGSCKDRLPELLEIAMVTTAETESGRRIHSLVQASPRRRAQRTQ